MRGRSRTYVAAAACILASSATTPSSAPPHRQSRNRKPSTTQKPTHPTPSGCDRSTIREPRGNPPPRPRVAVRSAMSLTLPVDRGQLKDEIGVRGINSTPGIVDRDERQITLRTLECPRLYAVDRRHRVVGQYRSYVAQ